MSAADAIGRDARAFMAPARDVTYGEGCIVGYSDAPMYCIKQSDGTTFWWRADLTEVAP